MALTVRELKPSEWRSFQSRVARLEAGVTYPLGEDRFEIDHGEDYFAFFTRLGVLSFYVALDGQKVVAVCAAVLRTIPSTPGEPPTKVWYLCDLKVHPEYRRKRIPWKMFLHGFPRKYPVCPRGYAISMNPSGNRANPVVRLTTHFHLTPSSVGTILKLYSLDATTMHGFAHRLIENRGPISYLSLKGKKDIVLASTGRPMPLLHVQFGPCAAPGVPEPIEEHVHMFCLPDDDPLHTALEEDGIQAHATASVIHHRMSRRDWSFVLTSDI
ncbi:MAG: GNAT family N-acetyltransferase [Myxococcota bacterium]|jgi:hypothetical protein|nr:GNAT family N-acetyltransferase [Myxococcota bacterium]